MVYASATSLVLGLCATALFLIVMLLFRLTRVSWMLSILGSTLAIAIYIVLSVAINSLLEAFIRGWLWA